MDDTSCHFRFIDMFFYWASWITYCNIKNQFLFTCPFYFLMIQNQLLFYFGFAVSEEANRDVPMWVWDLTFPISGSLP